MSGLDLLSEGMLPIPKACEFSGKSRSDLYAAMGRGELAFCLSGRRRLIPKLGIKLWLAKGLRAGDQADAEVPQPAGV